MHLAALQKQWLKRGAALARLEHERARLAQLAADGGGAGGGGGGGGSCWCCAEARTVDELETDLRELNALVRQTQAQIRADAASHEADETTRIDQIRRESGSIAHGSTRFGDDGGRAPPKSARVGAAPEASGVAARLKRNARRLSATAGEIVAEAKHSADEIEKFARSSAEDIENVCIGLAAPCGCCV